MKLLLAGATGLVGMKTLELALADDRITLVVAPVRKPLPPHPKLDAPVVDYDHLPEAADWWRVDAVICALGTTMKKAGSREAFRRVDHDYPLEIARLAAGHGAATYVLNSAMGADADSRFYYNLVKGELERDLAAIGFPSLTFVRPGLIGGERQESRPAERVAMAVLSTIGLVLPKRWRINPAETIARSMVEAALTARPGITSIGSEELTGR